MANEDVFHLGVKALIQNKQGKILVLHSNPNYNTGDTPDHWDLPGGRIQKGDDIDKTLHREVKEEIGIDNIKIIKLLDASLSKMRIINNQFGLILFTYLCAMGETDHVRLVDDEHSEFKWCHSEEAADLLKAKFSDSSIEIVRKL